MKLTLSVRSRQIPDTSLTVACPPRMPSVPTSRATRVTSDANELSWSSIVFTVRADAEKLSAHGLSLDLEGHLLRQVALGDRVENTRDLDGRTHQIVDHRVDRVDRLGPRSLRVLQLRSLVHPALAPDDPAHATQLAGQALAPFRQAVERLRHVAHDAALLYRQPHAGLPVPR